SGSYSGAVATYEGGGYRALLQPTRAASEQTLRNLFDSLWLDRSTRAVFIDFTVYNPNVNLFCVARLVAELPATGGVVPSWEFRSLKLLRYVEPFDYFVAACECGLLLMCIYYTVLEVLEIRRQRMAYLKVLSNYLDVALLIVCYVCAGFNIYRIAAVSNKLHQLLVDSLDCPNFYSLSYWQTCFNHAVAIAVFLAWIKVFKYVRFSRTLTMLSATLGSCAKDLVAFCIIFFIIFFAFALLGTLVFGTQVDDFQNFQQAVFTCSASSLATLIGPVYFLLYVFFVFFILLNMFLAIINEKFGEVKADNEFGGGHARIDVARFLRRRADRLMDKLAVRRQKVLDIQRAVLQCGDEATVNFEGWRNQLRQRGFADAEIEALFAKYDADGDQVLSAAERMQMRRDLEGEKMKLDREITGAAPAPDQVETSFEVGSDAACSVLDEDAGAPGLRSGFRGEPASRDELAFLTRRVDRLEGRVGGALNSIDRVLMTLERLERLRLEHRTSLYRMLKLVRAPLSGSPEVSRLNLMEQLQQELRQWDSPAAGVRSGGIGDPHPAGVPDEGAEVSDIVRGGQLVHPLGVAEVFVPRLVEVRAEGDVMLRGLLSYATEGTETFLFRLGMAERLCLYSVQLFQWSCAAVEQRAVGEAVNALAAPVHTDIQRNVVSARDGGLEAPPDVEGGRSTIHIAQVHTGVHRPAISAFNQRHPLIAGRCRRRRRIGKIGGTRAASIDKTGSTAPAPAPSAHVASNGEADNDGDDSGGGQHRVQTGGRLAGVAGLRPGKDRGTGLARSCLPDTRTGPDRTRVHPGPGTVVAGRAGQAAQGALGPIVIAGLAQLAVVYSRVGFVEAAPAGLAVKAAFVFLIPPGWADHTGAGAGPLPAGQAPHSCAPDSDLLKPGRHSVQLMAPLLGASSPAGQAVQPAWPDAGWLGLASARRTPGALADICATTLGTFGAARFVKIPHSASRALNASRGVAGRHQRGHLESAGHSMSEIMAITGQKSESTVRRYLAVKRDKSLQQCSDAVSRRDIRYNYEIPSTATGMPSTATGIQYSNRDAQYSNQDAQYSNRDAQYSNQDAQYSNRDAVQQPGCTVQQPGCTVQQPAYYTSPQGFPTANLMAASGSSAVVDSQPQLQGVAHIVSLEPDSGRRSRRHKIAKQPRLSASSTEPLLLAVHEGRRQVQAGVALGWRDLSRLAWAQPEPKKQARYNIRPVPNSDTAFQILSLVFADTAVPLALQFPDSAGFHAWSERIGALPTVSVPGLPGRLLRCSPVRRSRLAPSGCGLLREVDSDCSWRAVCVTDRGVALIGGRRGDSCSTLWLADFPQLLGCQTDRRNLRLRHWIEDEPTAGAAAAAKADGIAELTVETLSRHEAVAIQEALMQAVSCRIAAEQAGDGGEAAEASAEGVPPAAVDEDCIGLGATAHYGSYRRSLRSPGSSSAATAACGARLKSLDLWCSAELDEQPDLPDHLKKAGTVFAGMFDPMAFSRRFLSLVSSTMSLCSLTGWSVGTTDWNPRSVTRDGQPSADGTHSPLSLGIKALALSWQWFMQQDRMRSSFLAGRPITSDRKAMVSNVLPLAVTALTRRLAAPPALDSNASSSMATAARAWLATPLALLLLVQGPSQFLLAQTQLPNAVSSRRRGQLVVGRSGTGFIRLILDAGLRKLQRRRLRLRLLAIFHPLGGQLVELLAEVGTAGLHAVAEQGRLQAAQIVGEHGAGVQPDRVLQQAFAHRPGFGRVRHRRQLRRRLLGDVENRGPVEHGGEAVGEDVLLKDHVQPAAARRRDRRLLGLLKVQQLAANLRPVGESSAVGEQAGQVLPDVQLRLQSSSSFSEDRSARVGSGRGRQPPFLTCSCRLGGRAAAVNPVQTHSQQVPAVPSQHGGKVQRQPNGALQLHRSVLGRSWRSLAGGPAGGEHAAGRQLNRRLVAQPGCQLKQSLRAGLLEALHADAGEQLAVAVQVAGRECRVDLNEGQLVQVLLLFDVLFVRVEQAGAELAAGAGHRHPDFDAAAPVRLLKRPEAAAAERRPGRAGVLRPLTLAALRFSLPPGRLGAAFAIVGATGEDLSVAEQITNVEVEPLDEQQAEPLPAGAPHRRRQEADAERQLNRQFVLGGQLVSKLLQKLPARLDHVQRQFPATLGQSLRLIRPGHLAAGCGPEFDSCQPAPARRASAHLCSRSSRGRWTRPHHTCGSMLGAHCWTSLSSSESSWQTCSMCSAAAWDSSDCMAGCGCAVLNQRQLVFSRMQCIRSRKQKMYYFPIVQALTHLAPIFGPSVHGVAPQSLGQTNETASVRLLLLLLKLTTGTGFRIRLLMKMLRAHRVLAWIQHRLRRLLLLLRHARRRQGNHGILGRVVQTSVRSCPRSRRDRRRRARTRSSASPACLNRRRRLRPWAGNCNWAAAAAAEAEAEAAADEAVADAGSGASAASSSRLICTSGGGKGRDCDCCCCNAPVRGREKFDAWPTLGPSEFKALSAAAAEISMVYGILPARWLVLSVGLCKLPTLGLDRELDRLQPPLPPLAARLSTPGKVGLPPPLRPDSESSEGRQVSTMASSRLTKCSAWPLFCKLAGKAPQTAKSDALQVTELLLRRLLTRCRRDWQQLQTPLAHRRGHPFPTPPTGHCCCQRSRWHQQTTSTSAEAAGRRRGRLNGGWRRLLRRISSINAARPWRKAAAAAAATGTEAARGSAGANSGALRFQHGALSLNVNLKAFPQFHIGRGCHADWEHWG
uniref:EF-hand domain-containing protein n=1 Tax=Macrostomum lignano TaxID=282301 RepID=A0A1I8I9L6_9PLAT